ncbi:MAG: hypothetical protein ACREN8_10835, partial [Candidatus Dormibacteraceae bacterium]
PLQGNVDSRLRQLDAGRFDALVLAVAGLIRLGREGRIDQRLEPSQMLPAPGQGALAIQARADDDELLVRLRGLDQPVVRLAVETERQLLAEVGGGCGSPVGALAEVIEGRLELLFGLAVGSKAHFGRFEVEANWKSAFAVASKAAAQLRSYLVSPTPIERI